MNKSYSKIRHIQESNMKLESRRFNQLLESKMGNVRPLINEEDTGGLTQQLKSLVGSGNGNNYTKICDLCDSSNVDKNNPKAKQAAIQFKAAITGLANPLDNFGGYEDEDSPAKTAGRALTNNLENAEDICAMIKYYDYYSNSGESFREAMSGELSYKVDSSENARLMIGDPIYKILLNQ